MPTVPENRPHLDWNDPVAVRRYVTELRVAFADHNAVLVDTLRRQYDRELGPSEHRRLHQEATEKIHFLLDYAAPAEDA